MSELRAFILGMLEFRRPFISHIPSWSAMCAYDGGRELAHRLTFRRFER